SIRRRARAEPGRRADSGGRAARARRPYHPLPRRARASPRAPWSPPAPDSAYARLREVAGASADGGRGAPMKALLVETDEATRRIVEDILLGAGYRVTLHADLGPAWENCRRQPFDLVVVSRQLPGGDSLAFCRRVRSLPGGEDTFVLLLAAGESENDLEAMLEACADDFVLVPVDRQRLEARVAVARRRGQAAKER